MAIIIEEDKKRINWFLLATILTIVSLLAFAVYYLFFLEVPLIEKVLPTSIQSIKNIPSAGFRPDYILEDQVYRNLKQLVGPIVLPTATERPNPFKPLR